jgi:hypothetical protein
MNFILPPGPPEEEEIPSEARTKKELMRGNDRGSSQTSSCIAFFGLTFQHDFLHDGRVTTALLRAGSSRLVTEQEPAERKRAFQELIAGQVGVEGPTLHPRHRYPPRCSPSGYEPARYCVNGGVRYVLRAACAKLPEGRTGYRERGGRMPGRFFSVIVSPSS